MKLEEFPEWVQKQGTSERDGLIQFNSFAKVKLFLLNDQVDPYKNAKIPEKIKLDMVVPGDNKSMLTQGFVLFEDIEPNTVRFEPNSNLMYEDKYSMSAVSVTPEFKGNDIILKFPTTTFSPTGGSINNAVISPLSSKELSAVKAMMAELKFNEGSV